MTIYVCNICRIPLPDGGLCDACLELILPGDKEKEPEDKERK